MCCILFVKYDNYKLIHELCDLVDLIAQLVDPTNFLAPVNFVPGPDL